MKSTRSIVIFLIVLVVALNLVGYYFITQHNRKNNNSSLTLYGNVDIRELNLAFRVFGKVQELFFDEGDRVNPGDKVAVLEEQPYKDAVVKAYAVVQQIDLQHKNTLDKLNRRDKLMAESISKEDLDDAMYNAKILSQQLEQAKAELAIALKNYKDTQAFCPSNGTILSRIREPGSVLNPGEPVFTIALDAPVWIRAYISEPNLGRIYPGMLAEIITDTATNAIYKGHIGFISPVAEFTPKNVETTELRTDLVYRLRIIVDNPDEGLRQGMPVTIKLKRA